MHLMKLLTGSQQKIPNRRCSDWGLKLNGLRVKYAFGRNLESIEKVRGPDIVTDSLCQNCCKLFLMSSITPNVNFLFLSLFESPFCLFVLPC